LEDAFARRSACGAAAPGLPDLGPRVSPPAPGTPASRRPDEPAAGVSPAPAVPGVFIGADTETCPFYAAGTRLTPPTSIKGKNLCNPCNLWTPEPETRTPAPGSRIPRAPQPPSVCRTWDRGCPHPPRERRRLAGPGRARRFHWGRHGDLPLLRGRRLTHATNVNQGQKSVKSA
jgi:hypothetical protein